MKGRTTTSANRVSGGLNWPARLLRMFERRENKPQPYQLSRFIVGRRQLPATLRSTRPAWRVIVQGGKRVTLGRTTYLCDVSSFLLTSVDVPLVSEIVAASERVPLLALFLKLDLAIVREILDREEFKARDGQSQVRPGPMGQTRSDLLQTCIRLVDLLDAPAEIPFFSNLIHREIVYRLLQYPQGDRWRAIARLDVQGRGTAKALAWLRANYMKTFRLNQLASVAHMGISTLHHHFRAVTTLSPLQYQKQLRLMCARERMLVEGLDATRAALEVGYETSVSSPANTNASSANRPCAMSKRGDSSALHPEAAEHAALLSSVSHEDLLNRKLSVHFPAPHVYLGFSRSKRLPT